MHWLLQNKLPDNLNLDTLQVPILLLSYDNSCILYVMLERTNFYFDLGCSFRIIAVMTIFGFFYSS